MKHLHLLNNKAQTKGLQMGEWGDGIKSFRF